MSLVILPVATSEEVDDEADRRDNCLSAAEADGHKATCEVVSVNA